MDTARESRNGEWAANDQTLASVSNLDLQR